MTPAAAPRPAAVPAGGGAGVRGVQLADHLVDDVHQLLAVGRRTATSGLYLARMASQSLPCILGS